MELKSAFVAALLAVAASGPAMAATPMTPGATPGTWEFAASADQSFSFNLDPGAYTVGAFTVGFAFLPGFLINGVTLSSIENGPGVSFAKVSNISWNFAGALLGGTHYVNVDVSGTGAYYGSVNAVVSAVPEPSTLALVLAGLGAVGFVARRRRPE